MDIRNIAIIAHVDHGKTTLVDELLKQSGVYRENEATTERAMDSNDIERERGITILAKCTSVEWKGTRINIVDTPGHADFGGEVERILSMVDGVVLLVDAAEGPMPQTKFVTSKALALGLRPIVVVNKVDKADGEPDQAVDDVFDLFAALEASDEQLDFPVMYASGRAGWCDEQLDGPRKDLSALFDKVLEHVPMPAQISRREEPFQMLATTPVGRSVHRTHPDRPRRGRYPARRRNRQGAVAQRRQAGTIPRLKDSRLPRVEPAAHRRGRGRRYRDPCRYDQGDRGRYDLRSVHRHRDPRPAD